MGDSGEHMGICEGKDTRGCKREREKSEYGPATAETSSE